MKKCLRCGMPLSEAEPKLPDISFYSCPQCGSHYAQEPGQELHDRWLMPLSLPLYDVIFDKDPVSRASEIANKYVGRVDLDLDKLEQHIEDELSNPKQKVSEIHNSEYANEKQLRDFLKAFKDALRELRNRT